jgi:uncharacterized membrane protein
MREWLVAVTEPTVVIIDAIAFLIIVVGALSVLHRAARAELAHASNQEKRAIWLTFARVLVAALTFQLAADIIESSISTSWESIGRLGAIAVIRTFIEFFLDRDVTEIRERQRETRERAQAGRA